MKKSQQDRVSYLCQSSLNELYEQSKQWLSEINLWGHELDYFHNLLLRSLDFTDGNYDSQSVEKLTTKISKLRMESFQILKPEISGHKNHLTRIISSNNPVDERNFKDAHWKCAESVYKMENRITNFKKDVFKFIKNLNPA